MMVPIPLDGQFTVNIRLKKPASSQIYFPAETGGVGCGTILWMGFVDFK